MKDLVIKAKTIRFEILFFIACVLFVNILNVYSIISYNTKWSELITELPFVLIVSVVLYVALFVIRYIFKMAFKLIRKK